MTRVFLIKQPEILLAAPVLDINQTLKCLPEIGYAEAEYAVTVYDCGTGFADYRRKIPGDATGAYFSCDYRGLSRKSDF